ncbi:type II secretion system minor pseudopilin GspK [Vibrio sp.]|uniref:type II secretion system minor pseudopilin GspK n=1 Tax=Vibrio sp. TaxID=678 RepID=UPI003D13C922
MAAKRAQSGVALIVILLLLAIMTSIAATMADRLFSQFKRAGSQLNYQQAYWYSIGIEALAIKGIEQSYTDNDNINLSQPWAIEQQTYPLDYGQVTGRLWDLQACFNLNALSAVTANNDQQAPYLVNALQRLIEIVGIDNYQAEVIAQSMWEFVDKNNVVNSLVGVEDSEYESLLPPYVAPNDFIADASELRAVYQVSGDAMTLLGPMICALPTDSLQINVNTLLPEQAPLLAAMFTPALSESDARDIIEGRAYNGWDSVEDFVAESGLQGVDAELVARVKPYLTVDSRYFELDAQVLVNESRLRVRSLLFSTNRETATVIRRRYGGIGERVSSRSTE